MISETVKTYLSSVFSLVLTIFFLFSCKEEDVLPVQNATKEIPEVISNPANQYVNSWILENMQYWYLWNNELPDTTDKNLDPESYFKFLLNSEDRFSWIEGNYTELLNSLQGISREAGYEFVLYREKEGSNNVILQIVYTKPGSPATTAGLKRGDIASHINGQQITTDNYQRLLSDIRKDHTLLYKPLIVGEDRFGETKTISLTAVDYSENPNFLHKVVETGGRKIGYFVYNFFCFGHGCPTRKV